MQFSAPGIIALVPWNTDPFGFTVFVTNDPFTVIMEDQVPFFTFGTQVFTDADKNTLIFQQVLCYNEHGFIPMVSEYATLLEGALRLLSFSLNRQYTEQLADNQAGQFFVNLTELKQCISPLSGRTSS